MVNFIKINFCERMNDYVEDTVLIHIPIKMNVPLRHVTIEEKDKAIKAIKKNVEESDVTYFRLGENDISELTPYIAAAKKLGTDILRLWCGIKWSRDYTAAEKEPLYAQCLNAADIASKHGVTFCMERHNNTFTEVYKCACKVTAITK